MFVSSGNLDHFTDTEAGLGVNRIYDLEHNGNYKDQLLQLQLWELWPQCSMRVSEKKHLFLETALTGWSLSCSRDMFPVKYEQYFK
jgi:hypothetical protein